MLRLSQIEKLWHSSYKEYNVISIRDYKVDESKNHDLKLGSCLRWKSLVRLLASIFTCNIKYIYFLSLEHLYKTLPSSRTNQIQFEDPLLNCILASQYINPQKQFAHLKYQRCKQHISKSIWYEILRFVKVDLLYLALYGIQSLHSLNFNYLIFLSRILNIILIKDF